MSEDRRQREALENLWSLAWRELGKHRLVAGVWRWADRLLVAPAAVLAVGAAGAGVAGVVDAGVAGVVALVGAVLAGVSVLADLPGRARRAVNAVTYLRVFTAEVKVLLTAPEPAARDAGTVGELRRWYMRINDAIGAGAEELRIDLLEFPPPPEARPRRRTRPDLVG